MMVFISWSGRRSKHIARALRQGLLDIFQPHLQIWLSAEDIIPSKRWRDELFGRLGEANYGILCLTPENLTQPWIHFEAGAISKTLGSRVCPYLYEVDVSALNRGPLDQFQAVKSGDQEANKKLVEDLNRELKIYSPSALEVLFNNMWLELEERLFKVPPLTAIQPSKLSDRQILEEVLESVRVVHAHKYLEELGKQVAERDLRRDELTTAMSRVIVWIFNELNLTYTFGENVDFEIVIHKQKVLIETKIGKLLRVGADQKQPTPYLQATLDQIKEAREEEGYNDARAIIVIPDYPDVAGELNNTQYLNNLEFCKITRLQERLSVMLKP